VPGEAAGVSLERVHAIRLREAKEKGTLSKRERRERKRRRGKRERNRI